MCEGSGFAGIGTIHFNGGLAFSTEIGQLGDTALHAEGHFILRDPGLGLGVSETLKGLLV